MNFVNYLLDFINNNIFIENKMNIDLKRKEIEFNEGNDL